MPDSVERGRIDACSDTDRTLEVFTNRLNFRSLITSHNLKNLGGFWGRIENQPSSKHGSKPVGHFTPR